MKKKPPAPRTWRDTTVVVDTMTSAAIDAFFADPRAGSRPFYLYYRESSALEDGALQFFAEMDTIPPGWRLADPKAIRLVWERRHLFVQIDPIVRRLPILASAR